MLHNMQQQVPNPCKVHFELPEGMFGPMSADGTSYVQVLQEMKLFLKEDGRMRSVELVLVPLIRFSSVFWLSVAQEQNA